jgi:hypothetical protein
MNRPVSPGVVALVLLLLAGVWIAVAPFVLSIQPLGAHWRNSTINDVAVGGALIGVSLLGIVLHVACGLRDLVSAAIEAGPGDTQPEPGPSE